MNCKKLAALFLSVLLAVSIISIPAANAAVFTFETQYEYSAADYAWLTDLVIKEDMESLSGLAGRVVLEAASDYPYTETASSFKNEVEKYCSLYSLNENAIKASYIYFVEMLGSNSSVFAAQASQEQVRIYLESIGITYPSSSDAGTEVLAKALYVALITGAFENSGFTSGMALEQALTSFVVNISGFSEQELMRWVPLNGSLDSLDEYVLAVSRMTLWSNGYDVSPDTLEEEVYKLMAVMTIRNLGYSVSTDVSFSELQSKYTAALLSTKYSVTVDPAKLSGASSAEERAYYILQLIGQKYGLSVRRDSLSYEKAFDFVAENTGVFDIEEGEFYADIFNYDIYLSGVRSTLWILPTSYYGGTSSSAVNLSCGGQSLRDNYYTRVSIDPAAAVQTLKINVAVIANGNLYSNVYYITVHQDPEFNPGNSDNSAQENEGVTDILSSGSIISSILDSAGVNSGVSDAASDLFGAVSDSVKNALSFISPTFGTGAKPEDKNDSENSAPADPARFITILDRIGSSVDFSIDGINGLSLTDKFTAGSFDFDFISFN
ncbi:MAG: hypothetical protein J1E34_02910 [Oscillospiraceae bacterium]|nr:hypothetical protein [Oscillospiraceae bacterium]